MYTLFNYSIVSVNNQDNAVAIHSSSHMDFQLRGLVTSICHMCKQAWVLR